MRCLQGSTQLFAGCSSGVAVRRRRAHRAPVPVRATAEAEAKELLERASSKSEERFGAFGG